MLVTQTPTSGRGRWRVDVRQPLMSNVPGVPRMLDPQLLVVQYTTKKLAIAWRLYTKEITLTPQSSCNFMMCKKTNIGPSAIDMPKILQFTASIKSSLKSRKTIVD